MSRIRSLIARRVGRLFVLVVLAVLMGLVPAHPSVLADGTATFFPIPTANSQPFGITTGPDGNLWFTESSANQIGRITPDGQITEFPIPTPSSQLGAITAGPDGNLWFAEFGSAHQIGRITPEGVITEFPTQVRSSGITTGPDGNLWFTWQAGIGQITPDGLVTLFAGPNDGTSQTTPYQITAGPDGNLWFTDSNNPQIGRMTPQGTFTLFPVTQSLDTRFITSGPDGNLWFTEDAGFGRMTPQGTLTEFADPESSPPGPFDITPGPDGNLWFTQVDGTFGAMTPAGVVTTFPGTIGGGLREITTGPDSNLWIVSAFNNWIVRFTPPPLDTTPPMITPSISGTLGNNGWYTSPVTVNWAVSDPESGIAFSNGCDPTTPTSDTAGTTLTCSATNGAGLSSSQSATLMIDQTSPGISIASPTTTSYLLNQVVTASYSCADSGSGVATCTGSVANGATLDTSTVGPHSFTVQATDQAGNAASQSVTYRVNYNICLLYDQTKAVQSGATIPIKLQLCDGNGTNVSASSLVVTAVSVTQISTQAPGTLTSPGDANPDSNFRFDATLGTTGGYIYNLSTKGFTTGTYSLSFQVGSDPMLYTVQFEVK